MTYDEIANSARELTYREKLKLAQLLLQLATKEEEEQNPDHRRTGPPAAGRVDETVEYVAARLIKLRPGKKEGVLNSISAMYQFQGGISEADALRIFDRLVQRGIIRLEAHDKVKYP